MHTFRNEREMHRYYNGLSPEQKIDAMNEILADSEHVVFLGGAGVSTESGIPDFRSKNGLYHQKKKNRFSRYQPEYLLSSRCLEKEPEVFFSYLRKNLDVRNKEPNAAHRKLAQMERSGRLEGIITQNIDGLHQKAGSRNVQEIHGTIWKSHCEKCGREYDADYVFDSKDIIPRCEGCGGIVRPDVVLYGEFLPEKAYQNSIDLIARADCLIIGGTSLQVGSAAQLAHMYHGKHLIIINVGPTKMEGKAELVFHEKISSVLEEIG